MHEANDPWSIDRNNSTAAQDRKCVSKERFVLFDHRIGTESGDMHGIPRKGPRQDIDSRFRHFWTPVN